MPGVLVPQLLVVLLQPGDSHGLGAFAQGVRTGAMFGKKVPDSSMLRIFLSQSE